MRRLAMTFALAAVAAVASPLSAQVRTTSFGLSGGLSVPMGDLADLAESGFNITGSLFLRPARFTNLGFRADIAFDRFGISDFEDSNIRSLGFVLNGQYNLPLSSSSVTPYVLAGLGFYSTKSTVTAGNLSQSASDSNLGYDFGVGTSFQLSGFATFLEAKYVHVMTEGEGRGVAFVPITFGVRF